MVLFAFALTACFKAAKNGGSDPFLVTERSRASLGLKNKITVCLLAAKKGSHIN